MSEQRELLWQAFLAGFLASGEGFNGEYLSPRYQGTNGVWPDAFIERIRPEFDQWLLAATR